MTIPDKPHQCVGNLIIIMPYEIGQSTGRKEHEKSKHTAFKKGTQIGCHSEHKLAVMPRFLKE